MHTKFDIYVFIILCVYYYRNVSCTLNLISMCLLFQKCVVHTKFDIYVFIIPEMCRAH